MALGASIHQQVDNGDAWVQRLQAAGAVLEMPPTDPFYGERGAHLRDPFGHTWLLGHSIEAVAPEEMQRRYSAMFDSPACRARRAGRAGPLHP